MRIGALLNEVVGSLFKKPITEKYPFEKSETPHGFRGKLIWDPEKCTGCQLCVRDCPAKAIEILVIDKTAKRFVMRYHPDRCIYCAQCVQSCRFKCLEMSEEDWELASTNKEPFSVYYGRDKDIEKLLAERTDESCQPVEQA